MLPKKYGTFTFNDDASMVNLLEENVFNLDAKGDIWFRELVFTKSKNSYVLRNGIHHFLSVITIMYRVYFYSALEQKVT